MTKIFNSCKIVMDQKILENQVLWGLMKKHHCSHFINCVQLYTSLKLDLQESLFIEPKPTRQYQNPKIRISNSQPITNKKIVSHVPSFTILTSESCCHYYQNFKLSNIAFDRKKGLLSFDEIMVFCNYYLEPATMTF